MKILALNLPQFHEVQENNEWWGEGFTEWTNVKRAKPLFPGHRQPMAPLNGNYYDLSKKDAVVAQARLAREYGITGFIYFHYWYNGRKLLERPCEILLDAPEADIEYCFCWANHSWTRAWDGKNHQVLLSQTYGEAEDWDNHLDYLLPFFRDGRYIKVDGKPMLVVYSASDIPQVDEMVRYWSNRLKSEGFSGIYIVEYISTKNPNPACSLSQAVYEDEPVYSLRFEINAFEKAKRVLVKTIKVPEYQDYDEIWNHILKKSRTYGGRSILQGGFTAWDNSPRRGAKGCMVVKGSTPEKFYGYLKRLIEMSKKRADASNDYIIVNAWNEWGEGAILEPSEAYEYAYLKAVKRAIKDACIV